MSACILWVAFRRFGFRHSQMWSSLFFLLSLVPATVLAAGFVDQVDTVVVSGWACGGSGESRWIHIYDGSNYVGSTTSNTVRRQDAAVFCAGKEWVGFSMETPRLTGGVHTIHAYASDSSTPSQENLLPGSTSLVVPQADFVGPSPFGVIESASFSALSGWACDQDGSGPVSIEVLIQYHSTGPLLPLADGLALDSRTGGVSCGAGVARNFIVTLPVVRGGTHNLAVRAKNAGAGDDRYLEEFVTGIRRVSFPAAPSLNVDPLVMRAADCWYQNASSMRYEGCLPGMDPWVFSISKTVFTGQAPAPEAGYVGPQARVRYDGLSQGTVLKIETYDTSSTMYPWDYNFQALATNMDELPLGSSDDLTLRVTLGIRADWRYSNPENGPAPGIDTGTSPWLNLIVASVFRHKTTGVVYFIEALPYVHGPYPSQTVVGGPPEARNARVRFADLVGAVSLPTQMLVGEVRTFEMDLQASFDTAFASESVRPNWEDLIYTGSYVGTEQYGKHRFAIDVSQLSVTR
ncbi:MULTISPECIES: hypothetical protein [unclassified Pseudoxanthomonas]|uniref:hypothetical protein n=1 Tax=unclassified Pseudoxanthomonas TaxID=2645906 RepID=UPI0008E18E7F|nr:MULTISPECIES: hypothetical protein [unclassified Pseudoxanthomonas]SFV27045.1 hypothetical protein SAMN05428990_0556 [Pseudoxanthomonas sp. YR558]